MQGKGLYEIQQDLEYPLARPKYDPFRSLPRQFGRFYRNGARPFRSVTSRDTALVCI